MALQAEDAKVRLTTDTVTVTADVNDADIQQPDPAQRVFVRDEILDANPGRPGAPVSIPGLPIETASSGIKAPQYFAPGVAGDHGEPIAQFIRVGSFLMPNNLSANAHGNGYSDPNIMVPAIIESVQTDGGAFNVLEGNHSVDVAAVYAIRPSLEPFATLTGDYRDIDLSAGWNWFAIQTSAGNGFLDAPEHRRQYKINALKSWTRGAHSLTFLGIGYYGESRIPGLVPVGHSQSSRHHRFAPAGPDPYDRVCPERRMAPDAEQRVTAIELLPDLQSRPLFKLWRRPHPAKRIPHRDGR